MLSGRVLLLLAGTVGAEQCSLDTLSPSSGPTLGGTLVNLTGTALGDGSAWLCSFNASVVGAEYHDDVERVGCFSPPYALAGAVAVNVSIDGGSSYCATGADVPPHFRYYEPPNVSAISPASGSTEGGTIVSVTGSGFSALGGAKVCTFGQLRVGDLIRAGAVSAATVVDDSLLHCVAPTADEAAAVGVTAFSFASMPEPAIVQPCVADDCTPGVEPERRYAYPAGHTLTLLGDALHEAGLIKLTRNRFSETGSLLLSLYSPAAPAGVPVREFEASWVQMVGRGSGADGYSFVYGALADVNSAFGEMGTGDGLVVRFRTRGFFGEFNDGHGLIEALYNGSALNQTFMGDRLRSTSRDPARVSVVKDSAGLSVYFDGELVLAATVPGWAPAVGWAFGFGARTGERKDDHWIDDVRVQSGYLLDQGSVAFGISLNGGHDATLLDAPAKYTFTTKPAVFALSPTTGPERGNTTVTVTGSHFAGGADYRCHFGGASEMTSHASYEADSRTLVCASPPAARAQLVSLEVSLNNRPGSASTSAVPFRFFAHPNVADARGPAKLAAPAGLGVPVLGLQPTTCRGPFASPFACLSLCSPPPGFEPRRGKANISLLGANFSGGDDYRVAFLSDGAGGGGHIVPATEVNDSLVVCVAPATIRLGAATVALSLNGQQYTAPTSFPFFAVHSLSPNTGPTAGGTLVRVNGTAFDPGGAYRCRFGDAGVMEASLLDESTLLCHSPLTSEHGPRALDVSLNALDFTASNVSYGYYAHPPMASVLPSSGPVAGATVVAARTHTVGGLGGGSHYRCAFGSEIVPATYVGAAQFERSPRGPHNNAELLRRSALSTALSLAADAAAGAHGAVLCVAPPNTTASTRPVRFAVSLNGQDYHAADGGFTYFAPPNVSALGPTRGPVAGGTVLTLVVEPLHAELLNSTSCRIGSHGSKLPWIHSRPVLAQLSPTTHIAQGVLQCRVPPADRTGALGVLLRSFSRLSELGGELYGDAALAADRDRPCGLGPVFSCGGTPADGYSSANSAQCEWLCPVQDGVLRLTSGDYSSSGSFVLHTPNVTLAPPPREFNASFEAFIGRASGAPMAPHGDGGLSFSVGRLPREHFGTSAAAMGLSVQLVFFAHQPALEVWYEGERLLDLALQGGVRTGAWVPCLVEVSLGSLSVTVGRHRLVDQLPLPKWDPRPDWRFGWSATSGAGRDEVLLDSVDLRATTVLATADKSVELTLNGQQYVPISAGSNDAFRYHGAAAFPRLVELSPSSGPIEGGTILRLATAHVDSELGLVPEDPLTLTAPLPSTSAYRCFLGEANITATFANGTVRCTTLAFGAAGAAVPLHFALNAQEPVGPVAPFVVYERLTASGATPLSGPTHGGTLVTVEGGSLSNGSDPRCRFGSGSPVDETPGLDVSPATFDSQSNTLQCVSPPALGMSAGPAELFISLNSQNYARVGSVVFNYTSPLLPASLSPTSGPMAGDTAVAVDLQSSLVGAFAPRCRFGDAVVDAMVVGGSLHCHTPPASLAPATSLLRLLQTADEAPPATWLYGDASTDGGAVRLTTGAPSSSGAVVVPSGAFNGSSLSYAVFRVSLQLRVHMPMEARVSAGDAGGDGFSVSYGLLPPGALSEYGGGLGLRVCFLTARRCEPRDGTATCPALEVYYATTLLRRVALAPGFRSAAYDDVVVEYSSVVRAPSIHATCGAFTPHVEHFFTPHVFTPQVASPGSQSVQMPSPPHPPPSLPADSTD